LHGFGGDGDAPSRSANAEAGGKVVTPHPATIDTTAASGGLLSAAWTFIANGELGTVLGVIAAALSVAVLLQRYRINAKELDRDK